jgi:hypothetical protein
MKQQPFDLRISMVWSLYILCSGIRGIRSIPLDDACEMEVMVTRIEFVVVSTPIFSVLEMCYYAYRSQILYREGVVIHKVWW